MMFMMAITIMTMTMMFSRNFVSVKIFDFLCDSDHDVYDGDHDYDYDDFDDGDHDYDYDDYDDYDYV